MGFLDGAGVTTLVNKLKTKFIQDVQVNNTSVVTNGVANVQGYTTTTVTLSTGSWSNLQQSKTVTGVTASSILIITPAPANLDAYNTAGVYCSSQTVNSLTFTCKTKPTANLTVQIIILL